MATPINQLSFYNLTGQPFDLGRHDTPRVGRDDEWERLLSLVTAARTAKSPSFGVLLGTYGTGKTFLLWKLAQHLRPAHTSRVLASWPIRLLDPEQKKDFTKGLVLRFFTRGIDLETELALLVKNVAASKIDCPSYIRPFVHLICGLSDKRVAAASRRVLTGGRISRKEAESGGFADAIQIKTNDDAMRAVQALQLVLKAAGTEALAFLIDETEYIDRLPQGGRASVLDSLKHVWDQEVDFFSKHAQAAPLTMILSATPDFWQRMTTQVTSEGRRGEHGVGTVPFFLRIKRSDVIEMATELEPDNAKALVISRMTEQREGKRKEELIPFTADYVDYVYELSQGLPRRIIEICAVVLTEAAAQKLAKIDRAAAKRILREMLISYEPVSKAP